MAEGILPGRPARWVRAAKTSSYLSGRRHRSPSTVSIRPIDPTSSSSLAPAAHAAAQPSTRPSIRPPPDHPACAIRTTVGETMLGSFCAPLGRCARSFRSDSYGASQRMTSHQLPAPHPFTTVATVSHRVVHERCAILRFRPRAVPGEGLIGRFFLACVPPHDVWGGLSAGPLAPRTGFKGWLLHLLRSAVGCAVGGGEVRDVDLAELPHLADPGHVAAR